MSYDLYEPWEDESRDYIHKSELPDTELMRQNLILVVKQLYSRSYLDKAVLESSLDNLCNLLDVDIDKGDLQIDRSGMLPAYLKHWVEFNTETLRKAQ